MATKVWVGSFDLLVHPSRSVCLWTKDITQEIGNATLQIYSGQKKDLESFKAVYVRAGISSFFLTLSGNSVVASEQLGYSEHNWKEFINLVKSCDWSRLNPFTDYIMKCHRGMPCGMSNLKAVLRIKRQGKIMRSHFFIDHLCTYLTQKRQGHNALSHLGWVAWREYERAMSLAMRYELSLGHNFLCGLDEALS